MRETSCSTTSRSCNPTIWPRSTTTTASTPSPSPSIARSSTRCRRTPSSTGRRSPPSTGFRRRQTTSAPWSSRRSSEARKGNGPKGRNPRTREASPMGVLLRRRPARPTVRYPGQTQLRPLRHVRQLDPAGRAERCVTGRLGAAIGAESRAHPRTQAFHPTQPAPPLSRSRGAPAITARATMRASEMKTQSPWGSRGRA